jgi:rhodanese-related sulfurtransferase
MAVLGMVAVTLFISGCGGADENETATGGGPQAAEEAAPAKGYEDISVDQLHGMMDDRDFMLVNVHIPFQGDLPGTDVSIPFDEITQHLDQLPADKDAKIVLYCRSGRMSAEAAEALASRGYTNVFNLEGGFRAWGDAGYEVIGG